MVIVLPPQAITCVISLVAIVIGERLATTLSGGQIHLAGLVDTQLLAVDGMEQVTAGESKTRGESAPRASIRSHNQVPYCESKQPIEVIGSQVVIVSPP
jgi:hypothetical protein